MIEFALLFILTTFVFLLYLSWPVLRHYFDAKKAREILVKKYNRYHKSRGDLLNHFDWGINSGDPSKNIQSIGREIEKIDEELR
jgi:hypothetical protein